jgi:hypothetical protein
MARGDETPKPLMLDYARPVTPLPRRKSALEVMELHYVAGIGVTTIFAATLMMMQISIKNYPMTLACGGWFVVFIHCLMLAFGTIAWESYTTCPAKERNWKRTVVAGTVGAVLVFGLPWAVLCFTDNGVVYAAATLIPLLVYPLVVPIYLLESKKEGDPTAFH